MALKLNVIIASTRPGRVGPAVAKWFEQAAEQHGKFAPALVDLADFNLPVFDEPEHPTRQLYQHAHTKAWAASVKSADAFVFVTPEYNFGPPPSLLNALNYLYLEWNYTPAGFVSYGGMSGGVRAVQLEKLTLTTLKIMPITEAVAIPMVPQHLGDDRSFTPNDLHKASATAMLDELHRWADALQPLRALRK
ncbi:MAG TPA: NAD(P)H-dependent oxidoreductase [Acetobacteraceae bacterium]|nr:NAD(P)H-dependent oxidoreductase [Acetobacteraceae bacterium]